MIRVASLYLPQLAIERLRRPERPAGPPDRAPPVRAVPCAPCDEDPGACSVPRGGGWRPGARWARAGAPGHRAPPGVASPAGARPVILVARAGQRQTVTAACPLALALGLRPGMAAAQARALVAGLDVRSAAPEADRAFLDRLALHAAAHWTPNAGISAPDGLWLDLTGTTHLFGGEAQTCRRLLAFLARLGFTAAIAIAGTPGAAHALARFGGERIAILPPGTEAEAIAGLPLAALRLEAEALAAAARFGLERIGDLYPMPRGPLARRLGRAAVTRLDQARGIVAEPIVPVIPRQLPLTERQLLEPIGTAEAIRQVIGDLVDDMVRLLERGGVGLRGAILVCRRIDGAERHIVLGMARTTRHPGHLKRMFAPRIERIEPGPGIEAMILAALRIENLAPAMPACALAGEQRPYDLAPLVDRLAGRIGDAGLFRIAPRESDVPERAVRKADVLAAPAGWPRWPRPVRLLRRPELLTRVVALLPDHPPRRFVWRGAAYHVVAGDGPERIHGEWWRSATEMWALRDYFRVETQEGERFWLFRRGDGAAPGTGNLSWYMHGAFG
jgi:protein ImuB